MSPPPLPAVDMAPVDLYNLGRVRNIMTGLVEKPTWELSDTASFDCMHSLGDSAVDNAAKELGLKPGDKVLDIGSGFSATGRYLYQCYGVDVTGIELQMDIHDIAETINQKNSMTSSVRSVHGDFIRLSALDMQTPIDHIISFLCILHIPQRDAVFSKAIHVLKPGGSMYIEDYFARKLPLDTDTIGQLQDVVSCPYLPNRDQYIRDLNAAGFTNIYWKDMSLEWTEFVHSRAVAYRKEPTYEPSLASFYDTVDVLFGSGQVGGVRITCVKKPR